jgi:hypothetical protein
MSLGIIVGRLRACWSNLQAVFTEWRHRIRFRYAKLDMCHIPLGPRLSSPKLSKATRNR